MTPLLLWAWLAAHDGVTVVEGNFSPTQGEERDPSIGVPPEELLAALPGTSVARDGGPLAPARPLLRGLSGARLQASVVGLSVADPATGFIDAAALPSLLGALSSEPGADAAVGGAVRVARPKDGLRAGVAAGSMSTLRGGLGLSTALPDGRAFLSVEGGSSAGDFRFRAASPVAADGNGGDVLVRQNNDQRRLMATAGADLRQGGVGVFARAFAAGHEGGVPGFFAAPTEGLRQRNALLVGGGGVQVPLSSLTLRAGVEGAVSQRRTEATGGRADVLASTRQGAQAQARLRPLSVAGAGTLDGGVTLQLARIALQDHPFARLGASGGVHSSWRMPNLLFRLEGGARAERLSDVAGPLLGGELAMVGGPGDLVSLRVARAVRAPTPDELFAPNGFIRGNAALRPESVVDVEAGLLLQHRASPAFEPGVARARAAFFLSRIDDAIVYVNKNAFEIAPDNTGAAWRLGSELRTMVEPHELLGIDVVAGVLWSRIEATGAALPAAPPWITTLQLRMGEVDGAALTTVVQGRGGAPTTLFGTLSTPAYLLVALRARLPLHERLVLGLQVENAFDVLDARDQNGLPLPGRTFTWSLEVRV